MKVGPLELKNRVMFPPLTTGYEERDGSIGARSLAFCERLAKGGVAYIVVGDVAPVMTASPTPKLANDAQIPSFETHADAVHRYGAKLALPVAERVKAVVSIPVATVGRVVTVEAGEKIFADGSADVIGYGRSLLCDPDIALKAATGEPIQGQRLRRFRR